MTNLKSNLSCDCGSLCYAGCCYYSAVDDMKSNHRTLLTFYLKLHFHTMRNVKRSLCDIRHLPSDPNRLASRPRDRHWDCGLLPFCRQVSLTFHRSSYC